MTQWLKHLFFGFLIGVGGVIVYLSPAGLWLEEKLGLSWLFHMRGAITAPNDVIVVAIDQPSATQLGLSIKPRLWPRDIHARLIDKLVQAGARVIIFDLIFDSPSTQFEHDEQLVHAIKAAGNVVLTERLSYQDVELFVTSDNELSPRIFQEGSDQLLPLIADAAKARAPFAVPKTERVNHYWTFKASAGDMPTVPVIALQMFAMPIYGDFIRLLQDVDPIALEQLPRHVDDIEDLVFKLRHIFAHQPQIVQKMQARLTIDSNLNSATKKMILSLLNLYSSHEKNYLNFYGPPRSIITIPYHHALQPHLAQYPSTPIDFKDKVVFVGFSGATQSEQDIVRDDYHTVFSNPDGLFISGVEIAATAFANLLENKPVRPLPLVGSTVFLFLFGLLIGIILLVLSSRKAIALGVLVTVSYIFIAYSFFKEAVIWLPLIIPILQVALTLIVVWVLKILSFEDFLGSSGPDEILDRIIDEDEGRFLGVCLATDIEGYTTVSEAMDPSDLERLMNEYRAVLRSAVSLHRGRVMDTTGDSSLSIWLSESVNPVTRKFFQWSKKSVNSDIRIHACQASLDLNFAIAYFNKPNTVPLPTRIGLHFGGMSLNEKDGAYRVTGDVVNTASLIQNANKILKTHILLSETVASDLKSFLIRPLGDFLLPGRVRPVKLFELITHLQLATQEQLWLCEIFARALNAYQLKRWSEAREDFLEILEVFPTDGPTQYFLSLCLRYRENTPCDPWPVSRIDSK